MITFKQYLEEATKRNVQQKWVQKSVTLEKAVDVIQSHCADSLAAFLKGVGMFRGFSKANLPSAVYIDSSESFRTSKDTNNLYQLAHDASVHAMHIPSRSNSLICTTSSFTAGNYADDHGFAVFPYDGTQVAVSNSADYFGHELSSDILSPGSSIAQVTEYLSELMSGLGFKNSKFDDIDELNSRLAAVDSNKFAFLAAIKAPVFEYSHPDDIVVGVTPSGKKTFLGRHNNYEYDDIEYAGNAGEKQRNEIFALIKSGDYAYTKKFAKLLAKFAALNKNKRFSDLSALIFTKASPGAKVVSAGSAGLNKTNVECWFSGECIVIRMDKSTLVKFKNLLAKAGHKKFGQHLLHYQ